MIRTSGRFYYYVLNIVNKQMWVIRFIFWYLLYYYNKRKFPYESFTLSLYKSYAGKFTVNEAARLFRLLLIIGAIGCIYYGFYGAN